MRIVSQYTNSTGQVTIPMPLGGRYIVIGDSLSYGGTSQGNTLQEILCEHRRPYAEQLAITTGISTTASLDRGESMKVPFYTVTTSSGVVQEFCLPAPGEPALSTAVPAATSSEWLVEWLTYPVFTDVLTRTENRVVLLWITADLYSEKLDKPAVTADEYEQNVGAIIKYLADLGKISYLGRITHVKAGTFIGVSEVGAVNDKIDEFNRRLMLLAQSNGYQDSHTGQWVSFGLQSIELDNGIVQVRSAQFGPRLDDLSDTALTSLYARDGLHFKPEGHDLIGQAWAETLLGPVLIETELAFQLYMPAALN